MQSVEDDSTSLGRFDLGGCHRKVKVLRKNLFPK